MQHESAHESTQSLNDIQDYLASFNKEIQDTSGQNINEVGQGDFPKSHPQSSAGNHVTQSDQKHGTVIKLPTGAQNEPISETSAHYVTSDVQYVTTQGQVHYVTAGDHYVEAGQGMLQQMDDKQVLMQQQQQREADDGDNGMEEKYLQDEQAVYIQSSCQDEPLIIAQPDTLRVYRTSKSGHDNENNVVQVLQSIGQQTHGTNTHVTSVGIHKHLQDTQLVAVQNVHDSSQPQLVALPPHHHQLDQSSHQSSLELLANASQTQAIVTSDLIPTQDGNVIIDSSAGSGQYQTVTIVPSDMNQGGEVSYVLIVSQSEQDKHQDEEDVDLSVYDFKEEQGHVIINEAGEEVDAEPKRIIKLMPKKLPSTMNQLMCNYCNYTSSKKYLLTRHMKTHSEERPHKCNICDRGFKTIASLQNHVNTHTGTKPHQCKSCEACFTTSGELVRHVRYRHTHEKPHRCTECDYQSVELSKMKRHMRSHTGERPYGCPHCSYASPDTYKLKRHLRIHTGEKPYECDICHARFTQSNSLKAHRLIHSGDKPMYQCELCPTTCGRKTDLKIHIQKLHTSDKPLQCRKCAKSFPDRYTYKIHMKTHEGEKCYKCELCPYAALSERHLQSHILTHTGEKPFECPHCDQTFRQKQLLKRHLNLYHTPDYCPPPARPKSHECSECDKCFAHKGNLLRHMALHDPESPMYQQLPPKTGIRVYADDEEDADEFADEDEDDDAIDQPQTQSGNKTVMIEVTQEGSTQQMFLLMEVPADGEINQQALQMSADQLAGVSSDYHHQEDGGVVPEGVEEAPDPSLMTDESLMDTSVDASIMDTPLVDTPTSENASPAVKSTRRGRRQLQYESTKVEAVVANATAANLVEDDSAVMVVTPPRRTASPRTARTAVATPTRATVTVTTPTRASRSRSNQNTPTKSPADASAEPPSKRPRRDTTPKKAPANDDESKRREEQIRKDIEECFGFDMDDDK